MTTLYVIGAADPEMDRIEDVLEANDCVYVYAMKHGVRVSAGNAYTADFPSKAEKGDTVVFVESGCSGDDIAKAEAKGVKIENPSIDHHRDIDAGAHMEAKQYWEASSLGQLYRRLGLNPDEDDRILAAMDHNFPAAMRGECQGIDPEKVFKRKVCEIAKTFFVSEQKVLEKIRGYEDILNSKSMIKIGTDDVVDMSDVYLGEGYSCNYLAAQVAVAHKKCIALLYSRESAGGRERLMLYGNASEETHLLFRNVWAPMRGYAEDAFGVVKRGYVAVHKAREAEHAPMVKSEP